jgi:hypothetical protein
LQTAGKDVTEDKLNPFSNQSIKATYGTGKVVIDLN